MIDWGAKWKIFFVIFISVLLISFALQKKKAPVVYGTKVELSVYFNEESPKNLEIIKSINRIAFLCLQGGLHDCERNLIPQRALYDGFLPRSPTGNEILDQNFKEFVVKTTSPLNIFDFEFLAEPNNIQKEGFYLNLINRNIESRLVDELQRRKKSFNRESAIKIEVAKLMADKNQSNILTAVNKATSNINAEFENAFKVIKNKDQDDFLTMKKMTVISPPIVSDETSLSERVFKSLFISLFITVYLLAFYVYYRKKG